MEALPFPHPASFHKFQFLLRDMFYASKVKWNFEMKPHIFKLYWKTYMITLSICLYIHMMPCGKVVTISPMNNALT